jgi:hypothetical protein
LKGSRKSEDAEGDLFQTLKVPGNAGRRNPTPFMLPSTLPHQEGDHAGAGRGGRCGWRTTHARRHLVPWAQEAEWIGVPPADHGWGPGRGEARDQGDVTIEVLRCREAPAPTVNGEQGAGVSRRRGTGRTRPAVHVPLEAPGRQVPAIVDQVVSFTIATDDVIETVPPPLAS